MYLTGCHPFQDPKTKDIILKLLLDLHDHLARVAGTLDSSQIASDLDPWHCVPCAWQYLLVYFAHLVRPSPGEHDCGDLDQHPNRSLTMEEATLYLEVSSTRGGGGCCAGCSNLVHNGRPLQPTPHFERPLNAGAQTGLSSWFY